MTVVEVGEAWRDRFEPGQRFVLQADIYYRGKNLAYGYVFVGGLAQYNLLGPAALDGDEGCYAIPVPQGMGYAEVALTEPWACVEAAYVPRRRLHVKKDGVLWIIGRPGLDRAYQLGRDAVLRPAPTRHRNRHPAVAGRAVHLASCRGPRWARARSVRRFMEAEAPGGFDDVIVLDPAAGVLDALPAVLAPGALVNLVGDRPLGRAVQVDAGRVHYDYTVYVGRDRAGPCRRRTARRATGPRCGPGGHGVDHRRRRADGPDAPAADAGDAGRAPARPGQRIQCGAQPGARRRLRPPCAGPRDRAERGQTRVQLPPDGTRPRCATSAAGRVSTTSS